MPKSATPMERRVTMVEILRRKSRRHPMRDRESCR